MTDADLLRLRARERGKRLVVVGLLIAAYSAGWLLVSWRASRMGETTCTVERVPNIGYCKLVHHAEDGVEHSLPWDSCDTPTRWAPTDIGGTMHCYYFRSFPDAIVFEPQRIVWLTPGRVGLLASGLVLVAAGFLWASRAGRSRSGEQGSAPGDPYRAPEPRPASFDGPAPSPLVILRARKARCLRWMIAAPFAGIGAALVVLDGILAWWATGEVPFSSVLVTVFCHAVAVVGLLGLAYRSGLVLDAGRGLVYSWWGVGRPWFLRYDALSDLRGADVHVVTGKGGYRELELLLDGGRTRRFLVDSPDAAVASVVAYLAEVRSRRSARG